MIWSSGHCKAGPPPGRNEFCRVFRQNKKAGFIVASRNRLVPTKGRLLAKNPHFVSNRAASPDWLCNRLITPTMNSAIVR